MNYNEELESLTESVSVLQRKIEHLLRDRELQRELEFEKSFNELMDKFGCSVDLILEVVVARVDVPAEVRSRLAEIANLDFEVTQEPSAEVGHPRPQDQHSPRPASENALAWQEKFGHKSLESWFN